MTVRISRAFPSAIPEIDRIVFGPTGDDPIDPEELQRSAWWVAGDGLAFAGARMLDNGALYLTRAGVIPSARGQGLQLRLIRARLAWGRRRGARVAITYTAVDNIASANNMIRAGFELYEPEYPWAGREMLYWRRDE